MLRKRKSLPSWLFLAGMTVLAGESFLGGLSLQMNGQYGAGLSWLQAMMVSKGLIPRFWISFSLVFARGNYKEFLAHWRLILFLSFAVPLVIVIGFYDQFFAPLDVIPRNSDTQNFYFIIVSFCVLSDDNWLQPQRVL